MLYFDTSFLAPLLLEEATSAKIEAFFVKLGCYYANGPKLS